MKKENTAEAIPCDGFTIIEPEIVTEEVSASGFIVPIDNEKIAASGVVYATTHPELVKSQKIAFRKYSHDELVVGGSTMYVVANADILAVIYS